MGHFKSNLRDIEFNLFEVFGTGDLLGTAPFADLDPQTARSLLAELDRLAREDLATSFATADRNPPVFDPATHTAPLPADFAAAYRSFMDAEFWRLDLPAELGGTPAPRALWWSVAELVLGANPAIWMYAAGPSFARTLVTEGTPEQRRWAQICIDRRWAATMVLTEPDAGSDVGAGRTRALPQSDGSWHIEGVKRFITGGEHDLAENIVHYVLARPVGVPGAGGPGTKGLSLFIVPKWRFDPTTGELGERNGVFATNLEHKMGLRVSNTCELTFGGTDRPAKGWLLGDVHEGIRQMFLAIENARMMVGAKAIGTLSSGYLNALEYARHRRQGADLLHQADKSAPRVTITHHPDVRRSLALQKAYAEGLRALSAYAASWQDRAAVLTGTTGGPAVDDDARVAAAVGDLLLPLVKGCGSERAYELLGHETLQTFGGSGYLQDYPIEQYVRDAKIDTLYEGTTAIQSLDLVFRKIVKDRGRSLLTVTGEIEAFLDAEAGGDPVKPERALLAGALDDARGMIGTVTGWLTAAAGGDLRETYKVGLASRRILLALGDVLVGWLLLRQAAVALAALDRLDAEDATGPSPGSPSPDGAWPAAPAPGGPAVRDADRAFYQGKVASARFFAREVLPRLAGDRRVVEATSLDLMDLPEDRF